MTRLLLFFCLIIISQTSYSQELSTKNNRASRFYRQGIEQYELLNYTEALDFFQRAISADRHFIEAYLLTGDIMFDLKNYREAARYYEKSVAIDPDFFPMANYNIGKAWLAIGEYEKSRKAFEQFVMKERISERYRILAERGIKNCNFAINAMKNPVPFNPVDIGPGINTGNDEYWPTLTADEQTMIFTRQIMKDKEGRRVAGNLREDFYLSYNKDGVWDVARDIGPPLNSELNEGAPSLTADGRKIFFTACNREDGLGSCDIYFAEREANQWNEPVNLGTPVNTSSWEAQPSVSPDGRTLYFASNRAGGKGNMDIWFTSMGDDGRWKTPENMGDVINTDGNEMSPFVHVDNQTLYFASDGHTGMGGYDLFVTRRDDSGQWSEPENLGYPINTHFDEMGLIVNARGDMGYFASDRTSGEVRDIYTFEIHPDLRPLEVSYLKGTVYDAGDGRRLSAGFDLIDLKSAETVIESFSDPGTGEFLVPLPTGKDYALNVSKPGYLFYSDHFSLSGFAHQTDPFIKDIPLHPVMAGEKTVLRNIFFEFDSYRLKPESIVELEKLTGFLDRNPDIRIRINGHTDNIGEPQYNLDLSEKRAGSVAGFLVEAGVDQDRIQYKGYGETMPVVDNDTEEGRAENRRTEFEIIGIYNN